MAIEAPPLYNFYFRYPWSQNDFGGWQGGMVSLQRGAMEGLFEGAVMNGFDLSAVSGMLLQATTGIAVGPTGYLMVLNTQQNLLFTPPTSFNRLDLIVIRPNMYTGQQIVDPDPTSPNFGLPVPLTTLQDCQLAIIQGTEANAPQYPAKQSADVVIAGIFLTPGMSSFPDPKYFMDNNKREIYGKNSPFQQNFGRYDDRLRPYRVEGTVQLGIKPSQLVHPNSRAFSFVNKTAPSIFPKTAGGLYNGFAGDTFINFQTGAITGADQASSSFSPTIPSAGNFINCTIVLNNNDTLSFAYGTQGTRTQCFDGIQNQTAAASAGGVAQMANSKLVAFVTLGSFDGVNITTIDYVDARGNAAIGLPSGAGSQGYTLLTANYNMSVADSGKIFGVQTTSLAISIKFPTPTAGFVANFKDVNGKAGTNNISFLQNASEAIEGLTQTYIVAANWWQGTWFSDGTSWYRMA